MVLVGKKGTELLNNTLLRHREKGGDKRLEDLKGKKVRAGWEPTASGGKVNKDF